MAAPFSLNGPAPQSTHVIVFGSVFAAASSLFFGADPPSLSPPLGPAPDFPVARRAAALRAAARSAAAAALSVTALGVTPSSPRALPLANTHQREMCMRMPLVLKGPPRHASQYSTFSPCSRSSCAARSGDSTAPRHARPTRPGATFTNAGSLEQHALTVLLGWFTASQSFSPRALVCATISESNKPVGPASLST